MRPRIQHVSLPRPPGDDATAQARAFYGDLLGLSEIPVPGTLAGRNLIWYQLGDTELHLLVEEPYSGSFGGHFCIEVGDVHDLRRRFEATGYPLQDATPIPGRPRFFCRDPFNHLVEFTTIEGNYLEEG